MMEKKYRKKPIVIKAIQWDGDNIQEILNFLDCEYQRNGDCLIIKTLEGNHLARPNDWIIKGVKGEYYPCKPDIFKQTYEEVLTKNAKNKR